MRTALMVAMMMVLLPAIAAAETEKTKPGEVDVALSHWHETDGYVWVYGTVANKSKLPISGQVAIQYLDAAGKVINMGEEDSDSTPFFAPIAPGQTGYFSRPRDVSKLSSKVASVKVALWYAVPERKSPVAVFSGTKSAVKDGFLTYEGRLKNSGNIACRMPTVVAVMMKGGKAVETSEYSLEMEELGSGQEVAFQREVIAPDGVDRAVFAIDCSPLTFPRD